MAPIQPQPQYISVLSVVVTPQMLSTPQYSVMRYIINLVSSNVSCFRRAAKSN